MFSINGLLLSLVAFTTVFAAPMEYRLEDIQCRCLSFSTSAKPTLCTYLESHGLDWDTAYSLASDNELKIQFASQSTISKVLEIRKPLPSNVLSTLSNVEAAPLDVTSLLQSENKIVCGLGDEVKHMGSYDMDLSSECHYVGLAIAAFILFLVTYLIGERIWTRCFRSQEGIIKLEGDEKALTAGVDHIDCIAPTDFS
ncbi:Nn.00g037570.m01.CDS01 [Neocucurbitaria sp. VM-36]